MIIDYISLQTRKRGARLNCCNKAVLTSTAIYVFGQTIGKKCLYDPANPNRHYISKVSQGIHYTDLFT